MYYFCLILSCIVLVVTTRGSWSGTLGGALSHTNTEVRLDLPLLMLGPHPLLVSVRSEPLGDLFAQAYLHGRQRGLPDCMYRGGTVKITAAQLRS